MATDFGQTPLPQDTTFVGQKGEINVAWHRAITNLALLPPKLTKESQAQTEAITSADTRAQTAEAALSARVSTLESNLLKDALVDLSTAAMPIGGSYLQAEVEAVRDRVLECVTRINEIITRLEEAKILKE